MGLSVGGHSEATHRSTLQWIPMDSTTYYKVEVSQLALGNIVLGAGMEAFGSALVDSGTTFTYFPTGIFRRVVAAIEAYCSAAPGCGAHSEGSGCWRLEGRSTFPDHFPSLTMVFASGQIVNWPSSAYLFRRGEPGMWCNAFADNGADVSTVLGVSWMVHKDIIFDVE